MFVLDIGDCEWMTLMRVLALLLGVLSKLFLITSTAFQTFLVFFGVTGKLITSFFFCLCFLTLSVKELIFTGVWVLLYSSGWCCFLFLFLSFNLIPWIFCLLWFLCNFSFCTRSYSLFYHIPFLLILSPLHDIFPSFFDSLYFYFPFSCAMLSFVLLCCWLTHISWIMKVIEII